MRAVARRILGACWLWLRSWGSRWRGRSWSLGVTSGRWSVLVRYGRGGRRPSSNTGRRLVRTGTWRTRLLLLHLRGHHTLLGRYQWRHGSRWWRTSNRAWRWPTAHRRAVDPILLLLLLVWLSVGRRRRRLRRGRSRCNGALRWRRQSRGCSSLRRTERAGRGWSTIGGLQRARLRLHLHFREGRPRHMLRLLQHTRLRVRKVDMASPIGMHQRILRLPHLLWPVQRLIVMA